ncbi:YbfB/YjiJ family MFS transporter [Marimonas lutisalis]|uniref:YbfB/YjiJ family MFS transporter n=1 Tax=Marimonas lutisalis TaxID=2545756 RepID=UPI0010F6CF67|nr:YbfB/YjiJ family MFS transporter [Marimonas lutisalis]
MTESPARPWLVLAGLALGVTVTNGFARFAYGLLLPAMKSELDWNYAQAGWLNTANAMGYVVGAILTMILIRRVRPTHLYAFGLVTTTVALLVTGLVTALWWQTLWRVLAGVFGAMSFSTAGALAAQLFQNDARRNALAIAILFGSGGGLGIVLAGVSLPLLLGVQGYGAWPWGWVLIGGASLAFLPLGLWSATQLRAPRRADGAPPARLPVLRMLGELGGYACFGMGYIVYLTFLSAWMTEQQATPWVIAATWAVLGSCICVSPILWRPVLARHASGRPLAMILTGIALGSALPVLVPGSLAAVVSAMIFGLCVFMPPGAITSFLRQNLPAEGWGAAISFFTVVFAIAQTVGPYAAGLIGDMAGDIGISLLVAAGILLFGATLSLMQRPLDQG